MLLVMRVLSILPLNCKVRALDSGLQSQVALHRFADDGPLAFDFRSGRG